MGRLPQLLAVLLFAAAPVLSAQEGPAAFDSREWDFGAIREADGVVRHDFLVFNRSDRPLRLLRAIPGCSCISARLPQGTLAPGQSAAVEVSFTPAGAAGPVIRTVEIQAGGGVSLGILSVSADVLPADRSIQERYPVVLAEGLYASRSEINFGYLERGRQTGKVLFVANASDKPMRLSVSGLGGTRFRAVCPETLAPGEEARVEIWCDTPADPAYFASLHASLRLAPQGGRVLREVPLSGLCLTQAPDSPDAPRLRNDPPTLRRKFLSRKYSGTLTLHNDGATPLVIHAIELPEGFSLKRERSLHALRLVEMTKVSSRTAPLSSRTAPLSSRAKPRDLLIAPGQTLKLVLTAPEGADGRAFPQRSENAFKPGRSKPSGAANELRMAVFTNDPLRPCKEIPINIL